MSGFETVALIAAAGATAMSTIGQIQQGNAVKKAADFEAKQYETQAGQDRAAAQRKAIEERRRAAITGSRVQAVAASSGAGVSDPTIDKIQGDIAGEGEYRALTQLYSGEERARGLETQASVTRYQGNAYKSASRMSAAGTFLEGASSFYSKYSGMQPKASSSMMMNPEADASLPWSSKYRGYNA